MIQKNIKVLFFGAAREATQTPDVTLNVELNSIDDLKVYLLEKYPLLATLKSFAIAQNEEYVEDLVSTPIFERATIAILPPVSGG